MGNLDQVAVRQLDYRGLLRSTEDTKPGGMTLEEETIHNSASRYNPDAIVNVCLALEDVLPLDHLTDDKGWTPIEILHDAIEILDHLDTLGMEIKFKP